jgi:hypothetical protein
MLVPQPAKWAVSVPFKRACTRSALTAKRMISFLTPCCPPLAPAAPHACCTRKAMCDKLLQDEMARAKRLEAAIASSEVGARCSHAGPSQQSTLVRPPRQDARNCVCGDSRTGPSCAAPPGASRCSQAVIHEAEPAVRGGNQELAALQEEVRHGRPMPVLRL